MSHSGFHATLWHNPRCSTSRNALALVRHCGIEPRVVEYLRTPPPAAELAALLRSAGLGVREALRSKEARFAELGLDDPGLSDAALLAAIERDPILLERPLLQTPLGVRLCRPLERALEILPPLRSAFVKENGGVVGPPG